MTARKRSHRNDKRRLTNAERARAVVDWWLPPGFKSSGDHKLRKRILKELQAAVRQALDRERARREKASRAEFSKAMDKALARRARKGGAK